MVETGDATDRLFSGILFKFCKCSLVADKRLRSGLKTMPPKSLRKRDFDGR